MINLTATKITDTGEIRAAYDCGKIAPRVNLDHGERYAVTLMERDHERHLGKCKACHPPKGVSVHHMTAAQAVQLNRATLRMLGLDERRSK